MFYMIFERCNKKFKSPTPSAKKNTSLQPIPAGLKCVQLIQNLLRPDILTCMVVRSRKAGCHSDLFSHALTAASWLQASALTPASVNPAWVGCLFRKRHDVHSR